MTYPQSVWMEYNGILAIKDRLSACKRKRWGNPTYGGETVTIFSYRIRHVSLCPISVFDLTKVDPGVPIYDLSCL